MSNLRAYELMFQERHGLLPEQAIDRINELKAALERARGLPDRVCEKMDKWALRINVDNGRMVPPPDGVDGEWITVRMANKMIRDELAAALKEEGK